MEPRPEEEARKVIDRLLAAAGWAVKNVNEANIHAARGVALREFQLKYGCGEGNFLLNVDAKAADVIEAKKIGATLTDVEVQSGRYSKGLPDALPAWHRPLPFLYESAGRKTHFHQWPRSRSARALHLSVSPTEDARASP